MFQIEIEHPDLGHPISTKLLEIKDYDTGVFDKVTKKLNISTLISLNVR